MTRSQSEKVIGKKLVKILCSILDGIDYQDYSNGRASNYLEYVKGNYKDELTLVDPVFFPCFAQEILGFTFGASIIPKEKALGSGKRPDFLPADLNLHPFVFETKGTDCENLKNYYSQVQDYLQKTDASYGILLNLRDIEVFTETSTEPIPNLSFSIEKLYRDFKNNPQAIVLQPNTKQLLEFVTRFSYQELDFVKKIEQIAESKPWTGEEILSLEDLTQKIREVVAILHDDVRTQKDSLAAILGYDNKRKEQIAYEVDAIAESMDSKKPKREVNTSTLHGMLKAKSGSLDEKAVDSYFYRVAYFTMTRILLVRLWEDINFIDESLYDGGFKKWYENFNKEIEKVLRYAFNLAGERYSWLFAKENNYTWYYPSDKALIDVLYEISYFNLSKLNADVLGTIYEEYVDRVDRKNKGQYYTPREVISFIWDRVGFADDEAFFHFENGQRKPKLIFDPATGSGGFLVEAARRLREEANYDESNFKDLSEIENTIISGLYGSEIGAFAYYITEINLLIQLTPIIKKILDAHRHIYRHPEFALSVIHQDSLKLHNRDQKTLNFSEEFKEKDEVYEKDRKHDIVSLEGQKRQIYEFIKDYREFDYVCANPPYIGEKGHKELFRATIEHYPYWKEFYQGKMDYLYWFLILGLSKLKEGGKLGFITTSYWPTADGAAKLRQFILDNALIKEMIVFGEIRIFEGAPGQHNMIFVLERCRDKKRQEENKIKLVKVKREFEGRTVQEKLDKLLGHIKSHIDKKEYSDEYIDTFVSLVPQGELADSAWGIFIEESSEKIIKRVVAVGTKLDEYWSIDQGVVPSPLRLTKGKLGEFPQTTITKFNLKIGDGVFVLTREEKDNLGLTEEEQKIIKPYFKNSDIEKFIASETTGDFLIYATPTTKIDDFPNIKKHLEKFRSILESRLTRYKEEYNWFKLHRSRDQRIFEGEKIVCSYRTEEASFAYHEGSFYGSTDMYFIKPKNKNDPHSLKYLLTILNSKLTDFWLSKKGKLKGSVKEQFVTPLENLYIRRVNFDNSKEVKIHNELVGKVDQIIKTKKELAQLNKYFPGIRLTRLDSPSNLSRPDDSSIAKDLQEVVYSLRTHPDIEFLPITSTVVVFLPPGGRFPKSPSKNVEDFYLRKIEGIESGNLYLRAKNNARIGIKAPLEILKYLESALQNYLGKPLKEIQEGTLLPKDITVLYEARDQIVQKATNYLSNTHSHQQQINQIVYKLYGLTQEEIKVVEAQSI